MWYACCLLSDSPVENKLQKKKTVPKSKHNEKKEEQGNVRRERGEGRMGYEKAREVCNTRTRYF